MFGVGYVAFDLDLCDVLDEFTANFGSWGWHNTPGVCLWVLFRVFDCGFCLV